jgi:hypothetical protein
MTSHKVRTLDYVLRYMIANKIPVTQTNYLTLAYFGDKSSIDELDGEELADLPEGFLDWPVDETAVN